MTVDNAIQAVTRLRCKPGDLLVLQVGERISAETYERLRESWKLGTKGTSVEGIKTVIVETLDFVLIRGEDAP